MSDSIGPDGLIYWTAMDVVKDFLKSLGNDDLYALYLEIDTGQATGAPIDLHRLITADAFRRLEEQCQS